MKHVIALTPFYDLKEEVERKAGESFKIADERYDELCSKGEFVRLDSEKEAPVTTPAKSEDKADTESETPKPARKTTRKKVSR